MNENDPINPQHYKNYRVEVIDILEDAVKRAPDPVVGGYQWQVLKYGLRMWDKENPSVDIGKLIWYAQRLQAILKEKERDKPQWEGEDIEPVYPHSAQATDMCHE